jgi:hypothetical protein
VKPEKHERQETLRGNFGAMLAPGCSLRPRNLVDN